MVGNILSALPPILQTAPGYTDSPSGSPAWPGLPGAKGAFPGARAREPPPNTAPASSRLQLHTPQLLPRTLTGFSLCFPACGRLLNVSSFSTELKLSHLWLGERCHLWGSFSHPVYFHGSALTDYFDYMKYDLMYSIFISNVFCTSWIGMSQTGVTVNTTAKSFCKLAWVSL